MLRIDGRHAHIRRYIHQVEHLRRVSNDGRVPGAGAAGAAVPRVALVRFHAPLEGIAVDLAQAVLGRGRRHLVHRAAAPRPYEGHRRPADRRCVCRSPRRLRPGRGIATDSAVGCTVRMGGRAPIEGRGPGTARGRNRVRRPAALSASSRCTGPASTRPAMMIAPIMLQASRPRKRAAANKQPTRGPPPDQLRNTTNEVCRGVRKRDFVRARTRLVSASWRTNLPTRPRRNRSAPRRANSARSPNLGRCGSPWISQRACTPVSSTASAHARLPCPAASPHLCRLRS